MKIVIHQSICGEVSKAWGLLKTTLPDNNIAKSLAFRTDLQEQTDGINWVPAIRGFSEGDYFLIMKTFEDLSTDVRRGRKFSHVLMILKREIIGIDNLEQIINLLPEKIDKKIDLEPVLLEISQDKTNNIAEKIQGRFNKLINGYINIKKYKNTLIWIGQENFNLVVIEFWKRLNEQERQSFKFEISFTNDNKETDNLNLIAIPESVQSKFINSGFFIIGKNDNHVPTELIEQLLIGDTSVQQRIHNFEKAIDSKSLSREDINFVAKGIDAFEQFESVKDIKKLNTLAHIIAHYAPSDKQGTVYKQQLLEKIIQLIDKAKFSDLVVLRNFKIGSYMNSQELLSKALMEWIKQNVFSITKNSTEHKLFLEHVKADNLNWWDKVIESELKIYLGCIKASKVSTVYAWLIELPSILSKIDQFMDKSIDSEGRFIEGIPKKISNKLIEELKSFSKKNHWLRLYAQLLNMQLELEEALTELIKIDQDKNYFEAIDIIITGKDQNLIVDYAVKTGEIRMIKIAGEICNSSPKYLTKIDVLNNNWQMIWAEAIENGNLVETGLKDPKKDIYKLFDSIIAGSSVAEMLVDKISQSEYGNLFSYPNSSKLWRLLPIKVKNNFLTKTSATLLNQLSQNSTTKIPDDTILYDHISQKGISDFLYFNRANIKSVLPIFEKFTQLHDSNLRDYLNNFSGLINAVEATQLGKLINGRRFVNSASVINCKATKSNNWRFALAECYYLLDFLTKGILTFSGILTSVNITTDQWWQSTEELIIELYPNSTSLTTIWKKSRGKESDLLTKSTPNEIWNDALYKVRRNQFKNITMNDLLKEIKKQYGDNQKFKIIYDLRKKYIKT